MAFLDLPSLIYYFVGGILLFAVAILQWKFRPSLEDLRGPPRSSFLLGLSTHASVPTATRPIQELMFIQETEEILDIKLRSARSSSSGLKSTVVPGKYMNR